MPVGSRTLKPHAFIEQTPHTNALRRLGLSRVGCGNSPKKKTIDIQFFRRAVSLQNGEEKMAKLRNVVCGFLQISGIMRGKTVIFFHIHHSHLFFLLIPCHTFRLAEIGRFQEPAENMNPDRYASAKQQRL